MIKTRILIMSNFKLFCIGCISIFSLSAAFAAPTNAYITQANFKSDILQICTVDSSSGDLSNCRQRTISQKKEPTGVAFYNNFAYVANRNPQQSTVSQCSIDPTGDLTNCKEIADPAFAGLAGITFDNGFIYVVNHGSMLSKCSVDSQTGVLSNCVKTGNSAIRANGVTFNKGYAYIANVTDDGSNILQCAVNSKTGVISPICKSVMGFPSAYGLAVNNENLYISCGVDTRMTICPLTATGGLSPCTYTQSFFANPVGITFYNNNAYVANSGNGTISQCKVDKVSGDLTACQTVGKEFNFGQVYSVSFH